jgi:hypothetical protein
MKYNASVCINCDKLKNILNDLVCTLNHKSGTFWVAQQEIFIYSIHCNKPYVNIFFAMPRCPYILEHVIETKKLSMKKIKRITNKVKYRR